MSYFGLLNNLTPYQSISLNEIEINVVHEKCREIKIFFVMAAVPEQNISSVACEV